jgi:hypothetical protein
MVKTKIKDYLLWILELSLAIIIVISITELVITISNSIKPTNNGTVKCKKDSH